MVVDVSKIVKRWKRTECTKRKFKTRDRAEREAERLATTEGRPGMTAYMCHMCAGYWHLGHKVTKGTGLRVTTQDHLYVDSKGQLRNKESDKK